MMSVKFYNIGPWIEMLIQMFLSCPVSQEDEDVKGDVDGCSEHLMPAL
jgi:hypothetical protein